VRPRARFVAMLLSVLSAVVVLVTVPGSASASTTCGNYYFKYFASSNSTWFTQSASPSSGAGYDAEV
jgi:hypothetical protein